MKKVLLVGLYIAVAVGLTVLAVHRYNIYHTNKVQTEAIQASKAKAAEQTAADAQAQKEASLFQANALLRGECQKGLAAYNALTSTVKAKTVAPNCAIDQAR